MLSRLPRHAASMLLSLSSCTTTPPPPVPLPLLVRLCCAHDRIWSPLPPPAPRLATALRLHRPRIKRAAGGFPVPFLSSSDSAALSVRSGRCLPLPPRAAPSLLAREPSRWRSAPMPPSLSPAASAIVSSPLSICARYSC